MINGERTCLMAGLRSSWYSARLARRDLTLSPVDVRDLCATPSYNPTHDHHTRLYFRIFCTESISYWNKIL